jgi:hypothetical protein
MKQWLETTSGATETVAVAGDIRKWNQQFAGARVKRHQTKNYD